jgi:hypothetical protein
MFMARRRSERSDERSNKRSERSDERSERCNKRSERSSKSSEWSDARSGLLATPLRSLVRTRVEEGLMTRFTLDQLIHFE